MPDHDGAYHGKRYGAVGDKVVVEAWQIGTAAVLELDCRVYIDAERMAALNGVEHLLALLLQQFLLRSQVLDYGHRVLDASQGSDVVQRCIAGERP
jgi:hypothetical protein